MGAEVCSGNLVHSRGLVQPDTEAITYLFVGELSVLMNRVELSSLDIQKM
jgi:hypothetical protein